jgi:AcrR family transcriptional regulator
MNHRKPLTARQREILDQALALVREGGLAAVTTKRLAAEMGFSEPALYRHFASKQALVLGLMDRLEDLLLGPIREIASRGDEPLAGRLERILHHHVRLVREQNSLPILLLAEASASDDPALLDRMRSIFHRYLALLEGLVREGQTHGRIRPEPQPDCLALLLLGAPAGLAIRHRLLPDARAEERFGETLLPFLIRAIATPEDPNPSEGDSP